MGLGTFKSSRKIQEATMNTDLFLKQVRKKVIAGEYQQAVVLLTTHIKDHPNKLKVKKFLHGFQHHLLTHDPYLRTSLSNAVKKIGNGDTKNLEKNFLTLINKYNYSSHAFNVFGCFWESISKNENAVSCFHKSIELDPLFPDPYNNIGIILHRDKQLNDAIKMFQKAISVNEKFAPAHYGLANCLRDLGNNSVAIEHYERAIQHRVKYEKAIGQLLEARRIDFCWRDYKKESELLDIIAQSDENIPPWGLLHLEDCPRRHKKRAQIWENHVLQQGQHLNEDENFLMPCDAANQKIRIGFISGDFHFKATIEGVLQNINKQKFEVYIFDYGKNPLQQNLKWLVDEPGYVDLSTADDKDIPSIIKKQRLDVAIYLDGYTKNGKPHIFAQRLARAHVSFTYAATMGPRLMDYVIADKNVIPMNMRNYYFESVVYLPHCFLPAPMRQNIGTTFTRNNFDLPEYLTIMANPSKANRISEKELFIWFKLLAKHKKLALMLVCENDAARKNLIEIANEHKIDKSRLIFAARLGRNDHLARLQLCDFVVDTFDYNGHTTSFDALNAGLPIVTMEGKQLASRVTGSMLRSLGHTDTIAKNLDEYMEICGRFVTNSDTLNDQKNKFKKSAHDYNFLKPTLYAHSFERALISIASAKSPTEDIYL